MSAKHPRPKYVQNDEFTDEEWDELEATEQFSAEVAKEVSELGAKYQLHPNTAFSVAAGVAISMLTSDP